MPLNFRPVVLIILDGFGIAPPHIANAIAVAKKPNWNNLVSRYPSVLLQASGEAVGLPWGQFGNSEVGHLNIGAGFAFFQNLPLISRAIKNGQFFEIESLKEAFGLSRERQSKVHLIGILGTGGVHGHQEHLEALISLAKTEGMMERTFMHLFLDGRDTAKDSGKAFVEQILTFCGPEFTGHVASASGRFYGMDRNKNWDRTQKAYEAIVSGRSDKTHADPIAAIAESYGREIYDEEFEPTVFLDAAGRPVAPISDGDSVICFNFRADRMRQITKALALKEFNSFPHTVFNDLNIVTFTGYETGLPVKVAFPTQFVHEPIAKVFSDNGYRQLHISETEKYAHVTFFINGMTEKPFPGEERVLIPSPPVASYDEKPEMSAREVTEAVLKALAEKQYDFFVINFANPDMVGHTGNLKASIQAIEAVDMSLGNIITSVREQNGIAFIVADHGNAEVLVNPKTAEIDKEHNTSPVPFIIVADSLSGQLAAGINNGDMSSLRPIGILADVAPTILHIVGLPIPSGMNGSALL